MAARVDIGTLVREVSEVHEQFPTWTLDNAFVHWFLQAFLVPDPETAARSVTGVSHDKGCDGVYIDESLGQGFRATRQVSPRSKTARGATVGCNSLRPTRTENDWTESRVRRAPYRH